MVAGAGVAEEENMADQVLVEADLVGLEMGEEAEVQESHMETYCRAGAVCHHS